MGNGIYRRGRPKRYDPSKPGSSKPGRCAGEYRIIDSATNEHVYDGISNNLERRLNEHIRSGKLKTDGTHHVDWMQVNAGATYDQMREHEKRTVKKKKPKLNKSSGGEGRPTNNIVGYSAPVYAELDTSEKKGIGCVTKAAIGIAMAFVALLFVGWFL